jgi:hypothetical protein
MVTAFDTGRLIFEGGAGGTRRMDDGPAGFSFTADRLNGRYIFGTCSALTLDAYPD